MIPLAANISGGGVRMLLHHKFENDTLVPIEIYLPCEPEPIIDATSALLPLPMKNYAATKQI